MHSKQNIALKMWNFMQAFANKGKGVSLGAGIYIV